MHQPEPVLGVSINTAHELGHKTDGFERWLAKITLAPVAYGHFFVEHNRGHHVRVATPPDPASARYGESFWRFLPRTVFGSIASAWRLEKHRLERLGKFTYDVMLCDWKMPGINGQEVYERIQADHTQMSDRVIFITGDVVNEHAREFLNKHNKLCLAKPFSLVDFREAIGKVLPKAA